MKRATVKSGTGKSPTKTAQIVTPNFYQMQYVKSNQSDQSYEEHAISKKREKDKQHNGEEIEVEHLATNSNASTVSYPTYEGLDTAIMNAKAFLQSQYLSQVVTERLCYPNGVEPTLWTSRLSQTPIRSFAQLKASFP